MTIRNLTSYNAGMNNPPTTRAPPRPKLFRWRRAAQLFIWVIVAMAAWALVDLLIVQLAVRKAQQQPNAAGAGK